MTMRLISASTIALEGICTMEVAEPLLQHLLAHPGATVDWRSCEQMHTAVLQILLMSKAEMVGPPRDEFLQSIVAPLLVDATK